MADTSFKRMIPFSKNDITYIHSAYLYPCRSFPRKIQTWGSGATAGYTSITYEEYKKNDLFL